MRALLTLRRVATRIGNTSSETVHNPPRSSAGLWTSSELAIGECEEAAKAREAPLLRRMPVMGGCWRSPGGQERENERLPRRAHRAHDFQMRGRAHPLEGVGAGPGSSRRNASVAPSTFCEVAK